jgi:flagellar basal body P-ring protein FlgI
MAIDLKYADPTTIDKVNDNINELSKSAIHKKVIDIDTSSIEVEMSNGDSEKIRLVLLQLINNMKAS